MNDTHTHTHTHIHHPTTSKNDDPFSLKPAEHEAAGHLSWARTGVTVSAHHISYFVVPQQQQQQQQQPSQGPFPLLRGLVSGKKRKKRRKALLRDVSMHVAPGQLCYLLGPSGAGKTTLLEVLAGRLQVGTLSGEVLFNGLPRDATFWRESSYVKQDDIHIPILTVQETLRFAARLRMGDSYTDAEREARVALVAELLGLDVCLHSICGDSLNRGISGGQLKRLSIGVEIMNMPSLIYLDEPTSGLDSVIAHEVMSFVHKLARQRRTVVATIHQPSPDTFALASSVVLLSGGRISYCGPSTAMSDYFQQLGFSPEGFSNPADFALAVVGGSLVPRLGGNNNNNNSNNSNGIGNGGGARTAGGGGGGAAAAAFARPWTPLELSERFRTSEYYASLPALPPKLDYILPSAVASSSSPASSSSQHHQPPSFPTSLSNQCRVLLERAWLTQMRQISFIRAQIFKNVAVATICGAIFYGQGAVPPPTDQFNQESFNISSILYFAMIYTILGNLQVIPQLFAMRVQYVRERSAFLYSTFAYWLAGALVNLPLVVVCHFIFINIAYFMVKLPTDGPIYWYTLMISLLNNLTAFYSAQFLAAAAPSAQVALAIFPVTFLFLTSFAGFTVPLQNLPSGWVWASYISYPRWCYEGLLANQFSVRLDAESTMTYYGFGHWDYNKSLPILFLFVLIMNGLVYWGLLPKRSHLKYDDEEDAVRATTLLLDGPGGRRTSSGSLPVDDEDDERASGRLLLPSTLADVTGDGKRYHQHMHNQNLSSPAGSNVGKGLKQKLLAADEKDLDIPRVLLESLTGTSDTASIDSQLNRAGGRGGGGWASHAHTHDHDHMHSPALDVKDYEMRSSNIQKSGGIRLLFRNLIYSVEEGPTRKGLLGLRPANRQRKKKTKKVLLRGASGRINPGEMCALMGGSGAGKTTLLDVLAGRKTAGHITGEIYFNGKAGNPSPKRCSYVTQDNIHIGCFTVRETLYFAAQLRIKESVGPEERRKRVEDVLMMLGLEGVGDVLVGDALRKGISGGQARRLTIGVEIINLPDMIFLDEPTTGLDSNISYEVMAAVRNLANQNRTVCCTIHQPSIEVFALFDKLILMASGEQVYYGTTHEAVKYFSSPTLDFQFVKGMNPAEFVMSASSGQGGMVTRGGLKRDAHELAELYRTSDLSMQFNENFDQALLMGGGGVGGGALGLGTSGGIGGGLDEVPESALENRLFPRDMLQINKILNQRQFAKMRRNRRPVVVGLIRHIVVALFFGSLYWQVAPTAIQSRLSLLFFTIMFVMVGNQQTIPAVYEDRLLYYREKGAHVYGPYSYWMTCAASYIPQNIINTLVYSAIVYSMSGLNSSNHTLACFGYFYLVVMLCSLCALFFCQLLSISLPSPQTAVAVFPATLFLFIAFAGFIVRLPSLPMYLGSWCPGGSFARWTFQGLVINEFQGNSAISYKDLPAMYYSPDPYQSLIKSLGFEGFSKWFTVPILLLNMIIFRVLAYLCLIFVNHEKR